jgi:hypothetical protein
MRNFVNGAYKLHGEAHANPVDNPANGTKHNHASDEDSFSKHGAAWLTKRRFHLISARKMLFVQRFHEPTPHQRQKSEQNI